MVLIATFLTLLSDIYTPTLSTAFDSVLLVKTSIKSFLCSTVPLISEIGEAISFALIEAFLIFSSVGSLPISIFDASSAKIGVGPTAANAILQDDIFPFSKETEEATAATAISISFLGINLSYDDEKELFFNGRHHHISFILTMQFALGIPPEMRSNFDYIFLLAEDFISNRKRLYDHYAGMFPTFEMFCQVMDQCTENYECLVINNNAKSNKLEDQVYWYKADTHPDFKLGGAEYWEYAEKHGGESNSEEQYAGANYKNQYIVDKRY